MLDPESHEYFGRRELAERAAAKSATSSTARELHQDLAQSYAELLRNGSLTRISEIRR
jgi:hypothetical protein